LTVFLIILAIIAVILVIPFGVSASYIGGAPRAAVRVLCFDFTVFPKKKKEKPKKAKKPEKEKEPKKPKKRRPEEEPEAEKSEKIHKILQLAQIGLDALGRFRRKLTVNTLMLHVLSAADDPYNAAMLYGYLNSAIPLLMPLAESALNIRNCDIRTEVSFETTEPSVDFKITLTISLARIISIVFVAGFAYLKLMIKSKREKRRALIAEERMVGNGTAEPNG
jgi:hypothetical protein